MTGCIRVTVIIICCYYTITIYYLGAVANYTGCTSGLRHQADQNNDR